LDLVCGEAFVHLAFYKAGVKVTLNPLRGASGIQAETP
jgi:hypothetical protein